MAYKDFYNLGEVDKTLVVDPSLLAIRNAVDSAVAGVSTVSQVAASYAKQYSVVEKQEVATDGTVTDVTSTSRRSVALYEVQDAKRRIAQVQANINQYLGNVVDAQYSESNPRTVFTWTQPQNGWRIPTRAIDGMSSKGWVDSMLSETRTSDSVTLSLRLTASDNTGFTGYKSQITANGSGTRYLRFKTPIEAGAKPDWHDAVTSQSLATFNITNGTDARVYLLVLQQYGNQRMDEESAAVETLETWSFRLTLGTPGAGYSYVTSWTQFRAGAKPLADIFDNEIFSVRGGGSDLVLSNVWQLTNHDVVPDSEDWAAMDLGPLPGNATLLTDAEDRGNHEFTRRRPELVHFASFAETSTLRAAIKDMLPDFQAAADELENLIQPGA